MTFDLDLYQAIPIFNGQQHTPIDFQTETPTPGAGGILDDGIVWSIFISS